MNYYICLAVEGDMTTLPTEDIAGMKELAAAYFEKYGDIRKVAVYPFEPKPPKQLTFGDIAKTREDAERQLEKKKRTKKPPAPKPDFKPPELPEVIAYAAERRALGKGMADDDAEDWFLSRARGGWTYGDPPKQIACWKSDFCVCERRLSGWKAAERKSGRQEAGYKPSFDLEAWEKSTLEIPSYEEIKKKRQRRDNP